jgi:hypothetical protein
MLYALLKLAVKIALRVFYKKVHIQTRGLIPTSGPLIVVANHPNTFMDPLVIAAMLRQQVYFLTNGSAFKSPLAGWLLKRMNMIPIYRQEDVPGKMPDNRATFAQCFHFLAGKGTLLIFPEGSSVNERRLRKLKTWRSKRNVSSWVGFRSLLSASTIRKPTDSEASYLSTLTSQSRLPDLPRLTAKILLKPPPP